MIKRLLKSLRQSVQNPAVKEKKKKKKKGDRKVLCTKGQTQKERLLLRVLHCMQTQKY